MDQYLNPRNLAAFAGVFAIACVLEKKYLRMGLWLAFAAVVHPLMAFFAFSFCALLICLEKFRPNLPTVALLIPFGLSFAPASPAYTEAVRFHGFHYILNWQWYEWVGILAPVALFWWFAQIARSRRLLNLERLCRALILYDLTYFAAALVISVPKRFESLARIQPLRSLHLLYILMLLFMGGLIAEYILKDRVWRWIAFFLPLCAGMFMAQLALFPASAHVEWPWAAPKNEWAQAFLWIRQSTPQDAAVRGRSALYSNSRGRHGGLSRPRPAQPAGGCGEGQRSRLHVPASRRRMAGSVRRAEELETTSTSRIFCGFTKNMGSPGSSCSSRGFRV